MKRRGFLGILGLTGLGTGLSKTVRQSETLPDNNAALEMVPELDKQFPEPPLQPGSVRRSFMGPHVYDIQDGILYDRIHFYPGATLPGCVDFFATPMGQTCPYSCQLKTMADTNMHSPGQLNAPRMFLARRVVFAVQPSAADADIEALSMGAYWTFYLMQKTMAHGPMMLNVPPRAEVAEIVGETDTGPDGIAYTKPQSPLPDEVVANSRYHGSVGTLIQTLSCFSFQVMTPGVDRITLNPPRAGGRGLDLLIGLVGLDFRGVQ